MVRLYTIGVESVSVSVLLLPAMLLGWELFRRNMPAVRKGMLLTFAVYLCAVYSATGQCRTLGTSPSGRGSSWCRCWGS